jgi:hypothetical protein
MLTCYFDGAGGGDHGFIVVCGGVASVAQWQQFEWTGNCFLHEEDFFDDWLEIGEGADGAERVGLRRTAGAAHRGQEEGSLHRRGNLLMKNQA